MRQRRMLLYGRGINDEPVLHILQIQMLLFVLLEPHSSFSFLMTMRTFFEIAV